MPGAGRKDQMAVGDNAAVACRNPFFGAIDPRRTHAQSQVDAMLGKKGLGPQRQARERPFPPSGTPWRAAVVGRAALFRPTEAQYRRRTFFAQARRRLHAGMACAEDNHRSRHRPSSLARVEARVARDLLGVARSGIVRGHAGGIQNGSVAGPQRDRRPTSRQETSGG